MENNFEVLIEKVGNEGKYQRSSLLIVFLFWIFLDFLAVSLPFLELNRTIKVFDTKDKKSYSKIVNYEICENDINYKNKTESLYGHSWTIEYDIECDKYSVSLIGSFNFTGVLLGSIFFQFLPDIIGRKNTISISSLFFSLSLIIFPFIKNLNYIYVNLVINQIFGNICILTSYMMMIEVVSISKRSVYGAIINSAFSIAGIIFIVSYKNINDWRSNFYITASLNLIVLIFFQIYLFESPRFLYSEKDYPKLYENLENIALINNREDCYYEYLINSTDKYNIKLRNVHLKICPNSLNNDKERDLNNEDKVNEKSKMNYNSIEISKNYFSNNSENEKEKKKKFKGSFIYLFTNNDFLIMCFLWFSTAGIYYGISINLKNLPGDIYTTGLIFYVFEIFSYILSGFIIETRLGRKYSLIMLELISFIGFFSIVIFDINNYTKTIISFITRVSISAIYNIIYTYSAEIYPTSLRAKGLGLNALFEGFGEILFPLIIEYMINQVNLFFSILIFMSFIFIFFLPETMGSPLKENIIEEESYSKNLNIY